jgi:hypothetical protein
MTKMRTLVSNQCQEVEKTLTFNRPKVHEGKIEEHHETCQNGKNDPVLVAKPESVVTGAGPMSRTVIVALVRVQVGVHSRA